MQHLITTSDFTKDEIFKLYDDARMFLDMKSCDILKGKIIVVLFFEIFLPFLLKLIFKFRFQFRKYYHR